MMAGFDVNRNATNVHRRTDSFPSKASGFTMVEIVLVMVIIVMVAAIATPRMGGYLDNRSVESLSRRIALDLAMARSEAIRRRTDVTVRFDVVNGYYEFVSITDIKTPDGIRSSYRVDFGEGAAYKAKVDLVEFEGDEPTEITYDPFGQPSGVGGVLVTSGDVSRIVKIDEDKGGAVVQKQKVR
jgi:type II secretion system protein H